MPIRFIWWALLTLSDVFNQISRGTAKPTPVSAKCLSLYFLYSPQYHNLHALLQEELILGVLAESMAQTPGRKTPSRLRTPIRPGPGILHQIIQRAQQTDRMSVTGTKRHEKWTLRKRAKELFLPRLELPTQSTVRQPKFTQTYDAPPPPPRLPAPIHRRARPS